MLYSLRYKHMARVCSVWYTKIFIRILSKQMILDFSYFEGVGNVPIEFAS